MRAFAITKPWGENRGRTMEADIALYDVLKGFDGETS